jgi:hypothetical protein
VRRDVDEQHVARLACAVQHVFVRRANAVCDQPVAHETAVDVDVLLVGARACRLGQPRAAADAHHPEVERDLAAGGDELVVEHVSQALLRRRAPPLLHQPAVVPDGEADVRPRQRMAAHRLHAVRELGGLALEELAPRRRREKQLAHLDAGAGGARRGREFARAGLEPLSVRRVGGAAGDGELGHRGDRRQRFAAETHRGDLLQVVQRGDLARRVAAQRERQLGGGNAHTVVLDLDGADAAARQAYDDLGGAGVQRVVDQFPHHRGRPLDHLAGGDLADEFIGQFADRPAFGRHRRGGHRRVWRRAAASRVMGRVWGGKAHSGIEDKRVIVGSCTNGGGLRVILAVWTGDLPVDCPSS